MASTCISPLIFKIMIQNYNTTSTFLKERKLLIFLDLLKTEFVAVLLPTSNINSRSSNITKIPKNNRTSEFLSLNIFKSDRKI